jgi:hypothetical protein
MSARPPADPDRHHHAGHPAAELLVELGDPERPHPAGHLPGLVRHARSRTPATFGTRHLRGDGG